MDLETIAANGLQFGTLQAGPEDGPLALLFHGFPDTAWTWDQTLPLLAEAGYRAVAPFLRGYAPTSIPPDGDYGVEALGRDVLALIAALGREQAVVVGHDWGAFAGYAAAALEPERISKLAIVAIPHPSVFRPGNLSPLRAVRARHFAALRLPGAAGRVRRAGYVQTIYRRWSPTWKSPPPGEFDAISECFSQPGVAEAAVGYYRALPVLGTPKLVQKPTTVPSLIVFGLNDGVADPALFEESRAAFTGPHEQVAVGGAGHFLHRERPEPFHEALLRFLA